MTTHVYSDKPSYYNDLLHYNKYAKSLALLLLEAETPFTVGISGEWGYGKTTLLHFLSYYLDKDIIKDIEENKDFIDDIKNFHSTKGIGNKTRKIKFSSIFLNTWPFINSKDIGESIFEQMMYDLIQIVKKDTKWYKKMGKFLVKTISGLIKTVKINGKLNFGLGQIGGEFNPEKFLFEDINYSNFKIGIEDILKEIIKKKGKLLIFIDDLDRLYPKQALEVMLFIKNFLDIEGCIFLIGTDNNVLSEGLEELFGKNNKNQEKLKKDFFEKIYQLEFKLPQIQKEEIKKYLQGFEEISEIIKDDDNFVEVSSFFLFLTNTLNPRKIKRAINIFRFLKNLVEIPENSTVYNLLLLEIAIIYETDINLYNNIRSYFFDKTPLKYKDIEKKDGKKISLEEKYLDDILFYERSTLHNSIITKNEFLEQILKIFGSSGEKELNPEIIIGKQFGSYIEQLINSVNFASSQTNFGNLLKFLEKSKLDFSKYKKYLLKLFEGINSNNQIYGENNFDKNFSKLLKLIFTKNISYIDYYDMLESLKELSLVYYDEDFKKVIQEIDNSIPF